MSKITKIDAAATRKLRQLITGELYGLGERLGLTIEAENATYDRDGNYVTFKVRCQLDGFDRREAEFIENHWAVPGLEASDYGAEFHYAGKKWRLVGVSTRARKWPLLAVNLTEGAGKTYKLPPAAVAAIRKDWESSSA